MGRSLGQVRPQPGPAATIGSATRTRVGVVGPGPGPTVRIGQGLAASQSSLSSCDAMICYSQAETVSESPGHLIIGCPYGRIRLGVRWPGRPSCLSQCLGT